MERGWHAQINGCVVRSSSIVYCCGALFIIPIDCELSHACYFPTFVNRRYLSTELRTNIVKGYKGRTASLL